MVPAKPCAFGQKLDVGGSSGENTSVGHAKRVVINPLAQDTNQQAINFIKRNARQQLTKVGMEKILGERMLTALAYRHYGQMIWPIRASFA